MQKVNIVYSKIEPTNFPNEQEQTVMLDYSKKVMHSFLIFHYFAIFFIITILLYQINLFPVIAPISIILIEQLLSIMLKIKKYNQAYNKLYLSLVIENLFVIFFLIALICNIYLHYIYFIYLGTIFLASIIYKMILHCCYRNDIKFQNINSILSILFKLLLLASYCTISLKIDSIIQISWQEVFWWFWILLALSLALGLITILMLANHFISIAFGDSPQYSKKEIKQILIVLLFAIFLILLHFFWIKGCQNLYDHQEKQFLIYNLINCSIYLMISTFIVFMCKDLLIDLIYKIIFEEEDESDSNTKKTLFNRLGLQDKLRPRYLRQVSQGFYKIQNKKSKSRKKKVEEFHKITTINTETAQQLVNQVPNQSPSNASHQCLICFDQIGDSVLMPCGHGQICRNCALQLMKTKKICFICRQV